MASRTLRFFVGLVVGAAVGAVIGAARAAVSQDDGSEARARRLGEQALDRGRSVVKSVRGAVSPGDGKGIAEAT